MTRRWSFVVGHPARLGECTKVPTRAAVVLTFLLRIADSFCEDKPSPHNMPQWNWFALGTRALLALHQQFRMYRIRREAKHREELFQIVTEKAADMIALVDVKCANSPSTP